MARDGRGIAPVDRWTATTLSGNGTSRVPTLLPGDHLLVDAHAYDHELPAVGDIVVVQHPFTDHIVMTKRVAACDGEQM
jgi:signal peptidase I